MDSYGLPIMSPAGTMAINVLHQGTSYPLEIPCDATISEIKLQLQSLYAIPWQSLDLDFNGQFLTDELTVLRYRIPHGAILSTSMMITIFYQLEFIPLEIPRASTILDIKLKLAGILQISLVRLELDFWEETLKDELTVVDYEIPHRGVITCYKKIALYIKVEHPSNGFALMVSSKGVTVGNLKEQLSKEFGVSVTGKQLYFENKYGRSTPLWDSNYLAFYEIGEGAELFLN